MSNKWRVDGKFLSSLFVLLVHPPSGLLWQSLLIQLPSDFVLPKCLELALYITTTPSSGSYYLTFNRSCADLFMTRVYSFSTILKTMSLFIFRCFQSSADGTHGPSIEPQPFFFIRIPTRKDPQRHLALFKSQGRRRLLLIMRRGVDALSPSSLESKIFLSRI